MAITQQQKDAYIALFCRPAPPSIPAFIAQNQQTISQLFSFMQWTIIEKRLFWAVQYQIRVNSTGQVVNFSLSWICNQVRLIPGVNIPEQEVAQQQGVCTPEEAAKPDDTQKPLTDFIL